LWTEDKTLGQDPETNLTGGSNGRGLQYFNSPNTKSFIFSLNLKLKMKKFTKYITPLLFACVAISCTDLADGINVDPNALSVSDAQAKNIFNQHC
jgi:hypothetical protein